MGFFNTMFSSTKVSILMLLSSPALLVQALPCMGYWYTRSNNTRTMCSHQAMDAPARGGSYDSRACSWHQDGRNLYQNSSDPVPYSVIDDCDYEDYRRRLQASAKRAGATT